METQVTTDTSADAGQNQAVPQGGLVNAGTTDAGQGTDHTESSHNLGWRKQLKGEYQTHEAAAKFNSPTELFQDYLEKAAQLEKSGPPESPDGYGLPTDAGEDVSARISELAHASGLNVEQAKSLYGKVVEERDTATQKAITELRSEYGSEYEGKVEAANRLIHRIGGDKALQAFSRSSAGVEPDIVRTFIKLAEMVSEDTVVTGRPGAAGNDRRTSAGEPLLTFSPILNDA